MVPPDRSSDPPGRHPPGPAPPTAGARAWPHVRGVFQAMTLMEYLIKTGSERVSQQCKENMYAVQTLKDFQYVDRDGKDQGVNVREKAKQLVALLRDEDRLREERAHALKTKEKLAQTATGEPLGRSCALLLAPSLLCPVPGCGVQGARRGPTPEGPGVQGTVGWRCRKLLELHWVVGDQRLRVKAEGVGNPCVRWGQEGERLDPCREKGLAAHRRGRAVGTCRGPEQFSRW